ncbi:MAG: ATP-binding protein, partial [Chloroflexi bacterium]
MLAKHPDIAQQFFASLTDEEWLILPYQWEFWARPKQLAPKGNWARWLLLAGRGFGKTKSLSEWVIQKARNMPGSRGAIVAPTAADVRDVLVEGESGIIASSPPDFEPIYESSKRRLTWPNGTVATLFSADIPDRLRGPQFHWAAVDELAAWRYMEAYDMLQFGLRLGKNPQLAIATTPRPLPIIKELLADKDTVVVTGTTYENRANLAQSFFDAVIKKYEGTRLGRQELLAHILSDVPGALWTREVLENSRVIKTPELERIVVAVDPAATTGQTGIVVAGIGRLWDGGEPHGYTLDDVTLPPGAAPAEWGAATIAA